MKILQIKFAGVALAVAASAALGGCAGGANYYVQDAPAAGQPYHGSPLPRQALADEVYLDGTGVTARRMAGTPDTSVETIRVAPSSGPSHAVARNRPTAIPRNEDISASTTTGSRNSTASEPNKPFTAEWLAKEKAEDDRLRNRMNICRGC